LPPLQPRTQAWMDVVGCAADAKLAVSGALRTLGIDIRASGARGRPGIVLFDRLSDEVRGALHEASRTRLERVAAVAFGAQPSRLDAARLLDAGASEVFEWSSSFSAAALAAHLKRWAVVDEIVESPLVRDNLVGESGAWKRALREVVEVARFTDVPLLLIGESGTGKELVARLVHALSPPRRPAGRGELIVLDCAAVPVTLSGSAFFGHEKGSFTGAVGSREGAFALADGGTLFLDEVGELPLPLQAELLRAVQEGSYKPIGSDRYRKTNFRLVCATNRDLLAGDADDFRRDFYYRIAGWTCRLPPLRERPEDVPSLIRFFLAELMPDGPPDVDPGVQELLLRRDYPGNGRELRHLVSRICLRHVGPGPITLGDLPQEERPAGELHVVDWRDEGFDAPIRRALASGAGLRDITAAARDAAVAVAVEHEGGNLRRAAARLGVTTRALQLRRARTSAARSARGDA
jgi:transcriptional regulator with GAF, ATPase, and Fis domain